MRDTPVPMSNTAVKSHYAGSSWGLPPVRYGRCQAKRSDCEAAFIGSLAQLGEHLPYKQRVGGSNPSTPIRSRSVVVITSPCHGEDRGFKSRRDRLSFTKNLIIPSIRLVSSVGRAIDF